MINPIMISSVEKVNCKAASKMTDVKHTDLPVAKELASDCFVKREAVKGPYCGIDCCAI